MYTLLNCDQLLIINRGKKKIFSWVPFYKGLIHTIILQTVNRVSGLSSAYDVVGYQTIVIEWIGLVGKTP